MFLLQQYCSAEAKGSNGVCEAAFVTSAASAPGEHRCAGDEEDLLSSL